jgi:hypothetical protein
MVIDDRLLRSLLLGDEMPQTWSRVGDGPTFTTSTWLYRLAQAVRSNRLGALSGPIAVLPTELQTQIVRRLIDLPSSIEILSGRELAWTMAGLVQKHRLNYLALEALATALVTGSVLVLSERADVPLLIDACRAESVKVVVT